MAAFEIIIHQMFISLKKQFRSVFFIHQYLFLIRFEVSYRSSFSTWNHGLGAKHTGHKSERKKLSSVTYDMDWENKINKMFFISLGSNRGGRFQFKQTFKLSQPYSDIQPICPLLSYLPVRLFLLSPRRYFWSASLSFACWSVVLGFSSSLKKRIARTSVR